MYLLQIYLPVKRPGGTAFSSEMYSAVRRLLTEKFGGVTTYTRAPAKGFWRDVEGVEVDDIIIFEVMSKTMDRGWWREYRKALEVSFKQQSIIIRAHEIEVI